MTETQIQASCSEKRAQSIRASFAFGLALVAPLLLVACPKSEAPDNPRAGMSVRSAPANSSAPPSRAVSFNGERALEHVRKQVGLGPRPPGSPELTRTREYILSELKAYGLSVMTDQFQAATPFGDRSMVNITAEIPGESKDAIMITSHYDSKYFKDMRFVGANDPGSSVGALLELARVLAANKQKPKLTYWLVFFDGEEAFCEEWDQCGKPGAPDNTYGSRRYVAQLQSKNEVSRVRALILLDMMGFKNLRLGRDTMSTKWLTDIVWQTARELGHGAQFVNEPEGVGGDDHEPFLRAGIDSVDIIQLSTYPYWHKVDDSLDKISAQSLKVVGDVVLASLPRIEQHK